MKILSIFFASCLLLIGVAAGAAEVETPKECMNCGMDRVFFARSRVLVTYEDGTRVGLCSLQCAVEDMKKKGGQKPALIQVGDYDSRELIDARKANWVIGGSQRGVMTALPKWAFAKEDGARNFMARYGGKLASFDEALKAAESERDAEARESADAEGQPAQEHAGHAGHHHAHTPGAQLTFNPAFGDDIYHTHPAGMWMANYRYQHVEMNGLRNGTSGVGLNDAIPMSSRFGYMMAPTSMSMDMHMLMLMYGVTDRFTVMGMTSYLDNAMEMVMNMGMRNKTEPTMRTSGLGDTELRGVYQLGGNLVGSLGVSLPTGDLTQSFQTMGLTLRAPYDMQLGSGTYDLKPALTYNALSDGGLWNWGGQVSYTYHPGKNDQGYSLGDNFKATGWLQRALGPASTWLRLTFNNTDRIHGQDAQILNSLQQAPSPDADPNNYGMRRLDGVVGVSFSKGPFAIGVEGGIPLYQNLNGLQLATDWFLTAGVQIMM